ncbi:MmgE/PrpD family protein [Leifsonia sp. NPDC058248]|uniref:MmgE/PrpD family protein n=1 Tax=Leifsonia sp. NPDC058248 TaxID=3346402 RepID=UPI0036DEF3D6
MAGNSNPNSGSGARTSVGRPTQVERLAAYAYRAQFGDLSPESVRQLPIHILDSLACSIAALGAPPINAFREQVQDFAGTGPSSLIAGGSSNPVYAAFWHTALVRYVDFMDNFLAPTETCHTADNFGSVLTAAEYVGASGRDLMLGVALSYTVQSRFVDHANFMTRGFDHTTQLAFSIPAAAGKLLGMSEGQIAHGIAMAASSDASFAVIRAKPLSQWKGLASAQSALGSMNAIFLARRGVQGPLAVIEGTNGIDNLLHRQIDIDWEHEGYEGVVTSTIKKYNAMIHTQSAVHCMIELIRQQAIHPDDVISIEADVTQITFDFAGGGLYGPVGDNITTKEQADHSLPYLLAVALLDGSVMPAQFAPDRINRADVQQLLRKVVTRPNPDYTREYPVQMPAKITVRLKDGTVRTHTVEDFPGMPSRPFSWQQAVDKFDNLVDGHLDRTLSDEIKDAVQSLATIQTRDLTNLLGAILYPASG